jgi:hypothetical protein
MTDKIFRHFRNPAVLLFVALASGSGLYGQSLWGAPLYWNAVGSWFGRAAAIPGQTICVPGSTGCAAPPEIIMVFTVNADGTFIGIDSNIFQGGTNSTAHGQWQANGVDGIKATFTLLQSSPATPTAPAVFIGGFKNLFEAKVTAWDKMEGQIHAYLYSYTNSSGAAILDSNGFPTPNPLSPPSACTPPSCIFLGSYSFKVQRVSVEQ